MKARRVKGLDPAGRLADNLERIVRVRLGELCSFMPQAQDPSEITALHDMRIAAKRLRYILEIGHPCFGQYAETAVRTVKDLQDVLGEIHDCDVQIPAVRAHLDRLVADDAAVLTEQAGGAEDLDPSAPRRAPGAGSYAGIVVYEMYLRARRDLLFERFLELWRECERKGFPARLDFAISERSAGTIEA